MSDAFTSRLSDYLDDEDVDARDRAGIEAHLRTCEACRAALDQLREVRQRAGSLPDVLPVSDLWPGIARRIDAPGQVVSFPVRTPRRISFTIPQFIAASLALMVVSGGMVWLSRAGGPLTDVPPISASDRARVPEIAPANFADTQYDQAVADLERTLQVERGRLDPETIRVLEANLAAIDRAIEQSRQALEADPASLFLNAHLAAARQRKLALLRRASALADGTSS
jgi:hypothetical protein